MLPYPPRRAALGIATLLCGFLAGTERPAAGAVTREQVERAIRTGTQFLWRCQSNEGGWPGQQGTSGLAVLALLTAGTPANEPRMANALERLRREAPGPGYGTYAVALQTMALAAADPEKYRREIVRNAAWLESNQARAQRNRALGFNGGSGGGWSYNVWRGEQGDNSNSQYALLGLNAAREVGVPVSADVLAAARQYWSNGQQRDGGWAYTIAQQPSTASMTCAGVASLILTGHRVHQGEEYLKGETIHRCGQGKVDLPLLRGLTWLGRNFRVDTNHGGEASWDLYYLYGLERAGRLSGQRFLGGHDWYREGAERLVTIQDKLQGSWTSGGGPVVSTSFALLFLAKGRAPVLANKLRHGPKSDWDNDRDDLANLCGLVSRDWGNLLTWQVIDPAEASVEDLLQAPIAFFNGHEAPEFSEQAITRLRGFIDQGGLIVADACCGREAFDQGFRDLIKKIFPEPEHKLEALPADHPVWRSKHTLSPEIHPLLGISYGCRTVVIYSPSDLSCYWNQAEQAPDNLHVIKALRVGQNIVEYATGRELPPDKLAPRSVVAVATEVPKRGALQIAKLRHTGDWNVAPLAVPHLASALRDRAGLDVVIQHREIRPDDPNLVNYPLLYIHGRSALALNPEELDALRRHLDPGGGTIFADAACGSPAFDTAFRKLVASLLPGRSLVPIPRDDPIYTRAVGYDLSDVRMTKAAGGRQGFPELEGIEIKGHWAVIYSRYDLGCALERPQGIDCPGYIHESAVRIAANIVLYSTLP
ncbi:MAG: DUF4159 domain-containing protein [Isosphaeraceae bacterium]